MSHKDESPEFLQNIFNWDSLRMAIKEVRFNVQIFITKWIGGDLATGKTMVIRKNDSIQDARDVMKIMKTNIIYYIDKLNQSVN